VLGLAGLLTIAAVAGKQGCGRGVFERGVNRWGVAAGMIPRGEVSLIFAGIGSTAVVLGQPVLSRDAYAAIVLMVMLTTAITPPVLKAVLARDR
jgi:Kef-type K+ transport system membrane component KefB